MCWRSERQEAISFEPIFFEIREDGAPAVDANGLAVMVEQARQRRQTHATAEIRTPASVASGVRMEGLSAAKFTFRTPSPPRRSSQAPRSAPDFRVGIRVAGTLDSRYSANSASRSWMLGSKPREW